MNKKFCYDYPRPALTVDLVIFSYVNGLLSTLLIQRKFDPFKGMWAFPGGFVDEMETAEIAALRELNEETGLADIRIRQLFTDSELDRDPRFRTVSVVYYGFMPYNDQMLMAGDDAKMARWFCIHDIPSLAFDHDMLIKTGKQELTALLKFRVFGKEILPEEFSLAQLTSLYKLIINDDQIVKKIIDRLFRYHVLVALNNQNHLKFSDNKYDQVLKEGFL